MAASQPRLSSGGSPFERRRQGGERHPQANPLAEHHDRAGKPLDTGRSVTNDLCKATVTEMREGDKSSRMTFRNKPRSSNGRRILFCRCQRAELLAARTPCLPRFSRDSECSLAARRAGEDCGTYSRLRRCGRSPALVTATSSDTTTVVEPDSRGGRSDAGSRVRRVGGQMAERSSAIRPAAVQLESSG
jgi:hypothetical protein